MIQHLKQRKAALVGAILISILSFIPGKDLPEPPFAMVDVLVHICLYLIWMIVLKMEARLHHPHKQSFWSNGVTLISITLFGGLIEIVQEWMIPGRFGDFRDFLANFLGALLGLLLYTGLQHFSFRRNS